MIEFLKLTHKKIKDTFSKQLKHNTNMTVIIKPVHHLHTQTERKQIQLIKQFMILRIKIILNIETK